MIAGRQHREQSSNIHERLNEGLSINGFGTPLNAEKRCVYLMVKIYLFRHAGIVTLV